jgi:hypothetical protein
MTDLKEGVSVEGRPNSCNKEGMAGAALCQVASLVAAPDLRSFFGATIRFPISTVNGTKM